MVIRRIRLDENQQEPSLRKSGNGKSEAIEKPGFFIGKVFLEVSISLSLFNSLSSSFSTTYILYLYSFYKGESPKMKKMWGFIILVVKTHL